MYTLIQSETKPWDELIRAFFESIIDDHGGLVAAVVAQGLFSTIALVIVVLGAIYIIRMQNREIKRMGRAKEKLEKQVLKKRISSNQPKKKEK